MTAVEQLYTEIMRILPDKVAMKYGMEILAAANKARVEEKNQHFHTWLTSKNVVQDSGLPKSLDEARVAFVEYYSPYALNSM